MDFKLTEEQAKIKQMAADFAANDLAPTILERSRNSVRPVPMVFLIPRKSAVSAAAT